MGVNGKGLAAFAAGSVLLWSGVKGWSVMGTAGDLVTGKKPSQAAVNSFQLPDSPSGPGGASGFTNAGGLAGVAQQYVGHAYNYGGAPGADGTKPWDCSSFVNFCAAIRLGLAIPGYSAGSYKGDVHGPPTGMWGIWPGLIHIARADVQAGDIIVWLNHMGIALANNMMISALNAKLGTMPTPIDGHGNGPILCYGRYDTGTGAGAGGGGGGSF